jgi:hypothetical protein
MKPHQPTAQNVKLIALSTTNYEPLNPLNPLPRRPSP